MRFVRNCVEIILLLIVLGFATYSQRGVMLNWIRKQTQPPLPEAVEWNEVDAVSEMLTESKEENRVEEEQNISESDSQEQDASPQQDTEEGDIMEESVDVKPTDVLPVSFNLAVPFTSQAPHGNWGEPYKESCEEASLSMVHAYYAGVSAGTIPAITADAELQKLAQFEKELFGFYEDTTAAQTGLLAEMFYGYAQYEVMEDPTVDQIKAHVTVGHPVIVPVAGRQLGNPYFTPPGPIYHMLVVRGYTAQNQFITNDPGTKHGEAYLYDVEVVMDAIHDWNGNEEITEGKKVVLVVYP